MFLWSSLINFWCQNVILIFAFNVLINWKIGTALDDSEIKDTACMCCASDIQYSYKI